jgi:hypothetical protein
VPFPCWIEVRLVLFYQPSCHNFSHLANVSKSVAGNIVLSLQTEKEKMTSKKKTWMEGVQAAMTTRS